MSEPRNNPVKADLYRVTLRFPRLFPDPAVFEDPIHLAIRFLVENGLSKEKSGFIQQTTDDILPVDDSGKPSVTSGTARFAFEGKVIVAEYVSNANVSLDYADLGSGLTSKDHSKLWTKGKLGGLRFELMEFKHQSQTLNIPDLDEAYIMMKERAQPNALSTIELEGITGRAFDAALALIKRGFRMSAALDGLEAEVYAARDLSGSEKSALEKRLTRESGKNTIFVILSRQNLATTQPAVA